jgi:DNA-binding NarL/FixJ family response regulator
MTRTRVLVADDHELIRQGLRRIVESMPGWSVCAEAATGREAVSKAARMRPQVVVLDVTMPDLDGLEATRQIRKLLPASEILILTMHDSEQLMHEAVEAGATGFVPKSDAGGSLLKALRSLADHRPFLAGRGAASRASVAKGRRPSTGHPGRPTPREREVIQLVAEGRSSKDIAERLGISVKTAETHRANVMRKLAIHSVSELIRYAIRNRLVMP